LTTPLGADDLIVIPSKFYSLQTCMAILTRKVKLFPKKDENFSFWNRVPRILGKIFHSVILESISWQETKYFEQFSFWKYNKKHEPLELNIKILKQNALKFSNFPHLCDITHPATILTDYLKIWFCTISPPVLSRIMKYSRFLSVCHALTKSELLIVRSPLTLVQKKYNLMR
jgi:hypothetical protein